MSSDGPLADVSVVSADSEAMLAERELVDYREYKREVLTWLGTLDKEPRKAEGYAPSTVSQASYRIDAVYTVAVRMPGDETAVPPTRETDRALLPTPEVGGTPTLPG